MGVQLRFKLVGLGALVALAATGFVAACGSDDGGGGAPCEGADCDGGGASETSTVDGPAQQDGNTPPKDGGGDVALDADADSAVAVNCGDGGAPGTLDESFGVGGMVWLKYATSGANAVAVQQDGKILVGGYVGDNLAIARLLAGGSVDSSFGTAGLIQMPFLARNNAMKAVTLQADGKIVAAGEAHATGVPAPFVVLRQLGDGGLDPSFGDGGVVLTTYAGRDAVAYGIAVLANGKVVVAGYSENRANPDGSQNYEVAQYNGDGTLDNTFGSSGRAAVDVRASSDTPGLIAVTGTGVLVGGASADPNDVNRSDISVIRLATNGVLDPSFGTAGKAVSNYGGGGTQGFAVTADSTGRALVGGAYKSGAPDDFALVRFGVGGTPDGTWGDAGLVTTDFSGRSDVAAAVLAQPDGKVVAAGFSLVGAAASSISIVLSRYSSGGALDPSFGTGGRTLSLPMADTNLGAAAATLDACHVIVVGRWGYNLSSAQPQSAMGVARYWR